MILFAENGYEPSDPALLSQRKARPPDENCGTWGDMAILRFLRKLALSLSASEMRPRHRWSNWAFRSSISSQFRRVSCGPVVYMFES